MVRGYHVYNDIWRAPTEEVLPFVENEPIVGDPFAVAVKKNSTSVGWTHTQKSFNCIFPFITLAA